MVTQKKTYNILVIEDNPGDFLLIEELLLEQIESPAISHTQSYNEAKEILLSKDKKFDVILLDLSLPDKTGTHLIHEIVEICFDTPVIVLTGYIDFDFGVKSLSLGISDYILKDELTSISLYKSIIYSLERKKNISSLAQSEKRYNELFHSSPLPMWVFDWETLYFLEVNDAAILHYGYTRDEFLSMKISDIRPANEVPTLENSLIDNINSINRGQFNHVKKTGEVIQVDIKSNFAEFNGRKAKISIATDITEKMTYVKAIEAQNEKLKDIAWIQSHVVRSPLARIMGFVNLIKGKYIDNAETEQILEYISVCADELDDVIRDITDKARIVNL